MEGKKRFRFFRFLGNSENIKNPISITIGVTGKVFVLQGDFTGSEGQIIKVFKPVKNNDNNNSSRIDYEDTGEDIYLKNENKMNKVRAVKIRIDNRGMIAICDVNNEKIHIIGEKIENINEIVTFKNKDTEVTGSTFNIKPKVDFYLNNNLFLSNFNRFRFLLFRKNVSIYNKDNPNKNEVELFMSKRVL